MRNAFLTLPDHCLVQLKPNVPVQYFTLVYIRETVEGGQVTDTDYIDVTPPTDEHGIANAVSTVPEEDRWLYQVQEYFGEGSEHDSIEETTQDVDQFLVFL